MQKLMFFYRPVCLVKNVFHYVFGLVFYFVIYGSVPFPQSLLGLLGFLIAYDGVYFYNDFHDWKEDVAEKRAFKPIVKGTLKPEQCRNRGIFNFLLGIALSFATSFSFGLLVSAAIALNVLHSHRRIALKKTRLLGINMFSINLIKFSLGWFAVTTSLAGFPIWFVVMMSSTYAALYVMYKNKMAIAGGMKRSLNFYGFSSLAAASFILSMVVYDFKLPMILAIVYGVLVGLYLPLKTRRMDYDNRVRAGEGFGLLMMFVMFFSTLLLSIPVVAQVNQQVCTPIDHLRDNITEHAPESIVKTMNAVERSVPDDLTEIPQMVIFNRLPA